jgi:hypothetical protein
MTPLILVPLGGAATHEGFPELRPVARSWPIQQSDKCAGCCSPDRIQDFRAYLLGRQTPWHDGKTCRNKMRALSSIMNQLIRYRRSEDPGSLQIRDCELHLLQDQNFKGRSQKRKLTNRKVVTSQTT